MAAGLALNEEKIEEFTKAINNSVASIDEKDFIPKDELMGMLETNSIDTELLNIFEQFEPYGEANPRPSFLIQDADIVEIKVMGKDKNHCKIVVRQNKHEKQTLELILFKQVLQMPHNKKITCSYSVTKNEWNNRVSPQLLVNKLYI